MHESNFDPSKLLFQESSSYPPVEIDKKRLFNIELTEVFNRKFLVNIICKNCEKDNEVSFLDHTQTFYSYHCAIECAKFFKATGMFFD